MKYTCFCFTFSLSENAIDCISRGKDQNMPPQTISYYKAEEETPSLHAGVCTQQLHPLLPASPAAATAQQ